MLNVNESFVVAPNTKRCDQEVTRGAEGSMAAPRTKRGDLEVLRGAGSEWSHLEQRKPTWRFRDKLTVRGCT